MAVSQQTNPDVATEYATLRYVIQQTLARVATCTVVRVVKCTNAGGVAPVGFVDVQPVVNMQDGAGVTWEYGTLFTLPYSRLQGGACAVILDPKPGDIGLVCFASRDISVAKSATGRDQIKTGTVPPGTRRQFDISDGVYVGGILNGNPTTWVRFTDDGDVEVLSPTKVTIQAPTIELKGDVVQTDGDVSMSGTATAVVDVVGGGISLKNHTHGGVTSGGANTAPPNP